jgi:hypothetical protein
MDDTQAAALRRQRGAQEIAQLRLALCECQAMQVDFRLDAEGTAPQPAQQRLGYPGSAELQGVAGLDVERGIGRQQTFDQHRGTFGTREAGARRDVAALGRDALGHGQRAHAAHGLAKQLGVLINGFRHAFLRPLAFKYIGAPSLGGSAASRHEDPGQQR